MKNNCFIILCWFWSYVNINQYVYICLLPLESTSHLLPHSIHLGCHRAPDLSSLNHTVNSQWLTILHILVYMFPCYYLHSSHLLLHGPLELMLCGIRELSFPTRARTCAPCIGSTESTAGPLGKSLHEFLSQFTSPS